MIKVKKEKCAYKKENLKKKKERLELVGLAAVREEVLVPNWKRAVEDLVAFLICQ